MVEVGGKGEDDHLEADHGSLFLRVGGVAPSLKCTLTAAGCKG